MNIFPMFSSSMRVASQIDSAAHGAKPAEAEALINELCDVQRPEAAGSNASASDATYTRLSPYPS